MKSQGHVAIIAMTGLFLSSCSSRPREFVAIIQPPAADEIAYQRDFETCRTLARQGHRSGFKAAALSGGAGVAAGAGATAIGMSAGAIGPFMGATASAAATVALPVIGIGVGWGVSRAIRSGREKKLKQAMGRCLEEYGYRVETWTLAKKAKKPPVKNEAPDRSKAIVQR